MTLCSSCRRLRHRLTRLSLAIAYDRIEAEVCEDCLLGALRRIQAAAISQPDDAHGENPQLRLARAVAGACVEAVDVMRAWEEREPFPEAGP